MNTLSHCPICNSQSFTPFLSGKDYSFTQEDFTIVQCTDCGFKFTNPIPTAAKIGDYYKADNYISHTSSKKGLFERLYHLVRKRAIRKKFNLIAAYSKDNSLLDIGCGTGDFLAYSHTQQWTVKGIEPSDDARQLAANKGLDVAPLEALHQQANDSVGTITMWHVLEHVYQLNTDFEKFTQILKPEGHFFIAVPNCNSHDAQYYGEFWAAYDLPIHLYHFTPADIRKLADKYGMEVIKVLPMKFDSFYVSMLSEKYRAGKSKLSLGHMIKGFWRGLRSNMKANNETYSSQIYVLRHKKNPTQS